MKKILRIFYGLLIFPLLLIPIHAENATVKIPVEITGTEKSSIQITCEENGLQYLVGNPIQTIERTGDLKFTFDKPVDLIYKVKQIESNEKISEKEIILDPAEYTVHIFVSNSENDHDSYTSEVILYKSDTAKSESISFSNKIVTSENVNTSDPGMYGVYLTLFISSLCMIVGTLMFVIAEKNEHDYH